MDEKISYTLIKPLTDYIVSGIKQGYVYLNDIAELLPVEYIADYHIEELFDVLKGYQIAIYYGDKNSPEARVLGRKLKKSKSFTKHSIQKTNNSINELPHANLRSQAMKYLKQDPEQWANFLNIIRDEVKTLLTEDLSPIDTENSIGINLYEELVSPSTIYLLSKCENISDLKAFLRETIIKSGDTILCEHSDSIIENVIKYIPLNKFKHATDLIRLNIIDPNFYNVLLANPHLLKTLNWRVFEEMLADVLVTFGYEIELQKGSKDGGVDIFALKRDSDFGTHRYIIQAKRYKNKIGVEPVRQLLFLNDHYKATKSCLATTATFTRGAWQLAEQYKWRLELKDMEGIIEWAKMVQQIKNQ